jgi:hypothetical protein
VLFAWSAFAQDMSDALRYSNYRISGTARSQAMGNAFGALGGDFSSLSINPAGAAVYRSSEFSFSTAMGNTMVDGSLIKTDGSLGNSASDSKYNISINNIGYVGTIFTGANSESGLVNLSFGMGFNRLGGFTSNMLAQGSDMKSSLMSYFTLNANNPYTQSDNLDPYYERLAWDTYMLNYDDQNKEYFNDLTDNNYGQSVRKTTQREGHINEYLFSLAANFNHKFYIGGTLGIHDVYFREDANIYEYDANKNIPYFNEFNFGTTLTTSGYGYNLKIGILCYNWNSKIKNGIAIHTPTFYNLNDSYNSNMNSSITYLSDGKTENYSASPDKGGVYDYKISTPWKFIYSAAYVFGKSGLISLDIDVPYFFLFYKTPKLSHGSDGYDFFNENSDLKDAYRPVANLHIGGEYRINKNLSVRSGYEIYPNSLKKSYLTDHKQTTDKPVSTYSGGFGYKQGNLFIDATFQHVTGEESLKLYPDRNANEMVKYTTNQNNVILTLGFKF